MLERRQSEAEQNLQHVDPAFSDSLFKKPLVTTLSRVEVKGFKRPSCQRTSQDQGALISQQFEAEGSAPDSSGHGGSRMLCQLRSGVVYSDSGNRASKPSYQILLQAFRGARRKVLANFPMDVALCRGQ